LKFICTAFKSIPVQLEKQNLLKQQFSNNSKHASKWKLLNLSKIYLHNFVINFNSITKIESVVRRVMPAQL